VAIGPFFRINAVFDLADIVIGFIAIANLIGLVGLRNVVFQKNSFFENLKTNFNEKLQLVWNFLISESQGLAWEIWIYFFLFHHAVAFCKSSAVSILMVGHSAMIVSMGYPSSRNPNCFDDSADPRSFMCKFL
jgi:hypothetical protein